MRSSVALSPLPIVWPTCTRRLAEVVALALMVTLPAITTRRSAVRNERDESAFVDVFDQSARASSNV